MLKYFHNLKNFKLWISDFQVWNAQLAKIYIDIPQFKKSSKLQKLLVPNIGNQEHLTLNKMSSE